MTGADIARRILSTHRILGVTVGRGIPNRYDWRARRIYLSPSVYDGEISSALAIAAHEAAHAIRQSQSGAGWLVLFSRIEPFNYLLEKSTWRSALILLSDDPYVTKSDMDDYGETMRACLREDAIRATWHFAGMLAVIALALWLK